MSDYDLAYVGDPFECTVDIAEEFIAGAVSHAHTYLMYHYNNPSVDLGTIGFIVGSSLVRSVGDRIPDAATRAEVVKRLSVGLGRGVLDQMVNQVN